jgi:hypothetical protein
MNDLEIEFPSFDDLSDSERENVSDNGCGKECAIYLRVSFNGKVIALESDAMEPEDVTFGRDLNWIAPLIEKVYSMAKGV